MAFRKKGDRLIIPLGDRVCINPQPMDEVTKSGLILPDFVNPNNIQKGVVLFVGKGTPEIPQQCRAGDVVVFDKSSGIHWEDDGVKYKFLRQWEVLAIV